jgi:alkyl sulfatase BDS1-like metallo-beta-lactamase superfamily hydrolase
MTPAVTIVTFVDGGTAEIVIDRAASSEHIMDAMDLVRLMLQHGVITAAIKFRNSNTQTTGELV